MRNRAGVPNIQKNRAAFGTESGGGRPGTRLRVLVASGHDLLVIKGLLVIKARQGSVPPGRSRVPRPGGADRRSISVL